MSTLLALGLANAACAAVLAVPAYLVGRYAKRPALAHALWLLVLLKLVTPPFVRPSLAWLPAEHLSELEPSRPVKTSLNVTERRNVLVQRSGTSSSSGVILPSMPTNGQAMFVVVGTATTNPTPEPPGVPETSFADLALLFWVTGTLLCLGRALFFAVRFDGLLSHGRPAPAFIQAQAEELARDLGLRRCPRVWLIPGPLPPMVWGLGWVRLLFPEGLLTQLDEQQRASLLTHELAHVRRRDHWVRLLELAALTLFWWFPLAWWAKRQLQAREEECCDAWAAGSVSPRVYATAILEAVDFLAEARPRLPVMASALESKRLLKERLTLILTAPSPRRLSLASRVVVVAVALVVLPLLPTFVRGEAAAPPTPNAPEPSTYTVPRANFITAQRGKSVAVGMAMSPDGKTVAVGEEGGQIRLVNPRNGDLLRTLSGHNDAVTALTFSRDGQKLATSGPDTVVKVWQVADGKLARTLKGNTSWVNSLAFSRDGKRLASGSFDRSIHVWPLAGGEAKVLEGHRASVRVLTFSRDDKTLISGSEDRAIRLWDLASMKSKTVLKDHEGGVRCLELLKDGNTLISAGGDGFVKQWNLTTGKPTRSVKAVAEGQIVSLALSPAEQTLAVGNDGGSVMLYDMTLNLRFAQGAAHAEGTVALGFGEGGARMFSLGGDGAVKAWDGSRTLSARRGKTLGADAVWLER